MKMRCVAATIAAVACSSTVLATDFQEMQEQNWGFPLSPGMQQLDFQQFDDMGGLRTLKEVMLEFEATLTVEASAENRSTIAAPEFLFNIIGTAGVTIGSLSGDVDLSEVVGPTALAPSDDGGVGDSMGPDFHDYGKIQTSGNDMQTAGPMGFVGGGTIPALIDGFAVFSFAGTTNASLNTDNLGAFGTVRLIYKYSEIPAPGALAVFGLCGLSAARRRRH